MKTVIEYIDDLKKKTGSDYRSAKLMQIDKTTISTIRKRGQMADETAIKVADLLGIERAEVLIAATIARSNGEVKAAWEKISKRAGVAASVFMTASLTGRGLPPYLADAISAGYEGVMYIMLNFQKSWKRALENTALLENNNDKRHYCKP